MKIIGGQKTSLERSYIKQANKSPQFILDKYKSSRKKLQPLELMA